MQSYHDETDRTVGDFSSLSHVPLICSFVLLAARLAPKVVLPVAIWRDSPYLDSCYLPSKTHRFAAVGLFCILFKKKNKVNSFPDGQLARSVKWFVSFVYFWQLTFDTPLTQSAASAAANWLWSADVQTPLVLGLVERTGCGYTCATSLCKTIFTPSDLVDISVDWRIWGHKVRHTWRF